MLAAGIVDSVEARDRTADARHPEFQEHADRVRRRAHDVVDEIVRSERHGQLRSEVNLARSRPLSLSKRKLAPILSSSFRGAPLGARPESIHPHILRPDGFRARRSAPPRNDGGERSHRPAVQLPCAVEVHVEGGSDAAHEETGVICDRKPVAIEPDHAVGDQALQPRRGLQN
jgi:hypothetical protein